MQDRFKFRVWNTLVKKFNYFDQPEIQIGTDGFDNGLIFPLSENSKLYMGQYLEPQFCTGLKDKNGKLIYEGDIVSVKVETQDFFGEDEYYSENYKGEIIFEKGEIAIDVIDTRKHPISLYYNAKDCEVIGNIYENPELLEINNEKTDYNDNIR